MKNIVFMLLLLSFFVLSCSSTKHQVKEVNTKIDVHGTYKDSKIGLNDKNQAIIQTESDLDDVLKKQKWVNYDLENKLKTEHDLLSKCRKDIADPRLGGSGKIVDIPEVDNMDNTSDIKEEIGITESGELKLVKKEYYDDRLKKERDYAKSLRDMLKIVKKHRKNCELEMGQLRVKHGLPSTRYKAEGYIDKQGKWHTTRKAEDNLDDAFEIMNRDN